MTAKSFNSTGPSRVHKYSTRLKHDSLCDRSITDEEKSFITLTPRFYHIGLKSLDDF
jgi:hypothetical protein